MNSHSLRYGLAFADGAFDAKLVLNDLVSKGFHSSTKVKPGGYGARIRDRIFDKTSKVQLWRRIVWSFNDRIWRKDEVIRSGNSRTMLRLIVYSLKILVRWFYG